MLHTFLLGQVQLFEFSVLFWYFTILLESVPFDNTIPNYLINLLWKLGLGLPLDLELHYFSIFHGE